MINRAYKKTYQILLRELLMKSKPGYYDECAIPSYAHRNKIVSWIFWKRINMALSIAGNVYGKSVLDFGCGSGVTFRYLHECNARITGCENQFYDITLDICKKLGIRIEMCKDLFELYSQKFDYIFALDVLEHLDNIDIVIDKFMELSDERTRIIVSGPTENVLYKIGRFLIGYQGQYHKRNIYDIEKKLRAKGLKSRKIKILYFPLPIFRISSWSK